MKRGWQRQSLFKYQCCCSNVKNRPYGQNHKGQPRSVLLVQVSMPVKMLRSVNEGFGMEPKKLVHSSVDSTVMLPP